MQAKRLSRALKVKALGLSGCKFTFYHLFYIGHKIKDILLRVVNSLEQFKISK